MSNVPTAPPDARKNRLERKVDDLTEGSPVLQAQGEEGSRSLTKIETGQSKSIKLSVRELLTALSGRRISITEIKFASNSSKDGGTFADVAVATLVRASGDEEERKTVAVKKLRFLINGDVTEEKLLRAFVNELRILDKLSHPNIVEIIGFVEDTESRIAWLVFPWEDNGNLREFLRSGSWELPERVSLIQDVALGLKYIHTRQLPICHGDLKSLNVLISSEHCALITDFGSARVSREIQELEANSVPLQAGSPKPNRLPRLNLTPSNTTLTLSGPECSIRWAPPDVLNGGPLDLASDVWALGWIAWEAITGSHPFEELDLESAVVLRIIEGKLPLPSDHDQLSQIHSLCSVMLSCWNSEPRERPSVTECWKTLRRIPSIIPMSKRGEQPTFRSARLLFELGEIHRLNNRHEEATRMYEQGLAVAGSTGDQTAVARLSVQIAESHRARGKCVEAETFFTQAITIYGSIGDDQGQARALVGLGDVQGSCFNYVDAEAAYTQAIAIYGSIGGDLGRGRALLGLGHVQRLRFSYVDAEASYTQAAAIFGSIGDDGRRANALDELGHVQRARSNCVDAEASFIQALAIYESIGDNLGRAGALVGLGHVQQLLSNYVDADTSYTQALAIYGSIRNDLGRARALVGLGDVQRLRSNDIDAEASYTQAMTIYGSIGSDLGQADALVGLGHVQGLRSNYVDAEASYTQAMATYGSIGGERGRANALVGLGDVQRARSNYVDAEASYSQAMAIYGNIGNDHGRTNSSLALSGIHLSQARYSEAKVLINDAARISERIHYDWGRRVSSKLLEDVLEAERISPKPRPSPHALPDTIHVAAAPLSPLVTDPSTSESLNPS